MGKRIKGWCLALVLLGMGMMLAACGSGNLREGDCVAVVEFIDIPEELQELPAALREQLEIQVRIQNIATEKEYRIDLNAENEYKQEVRWNPGIYKVNYCYLTPSRLFGGAQAESVQEQMELGRNTTARLEVRLTEQESFRQWVSQMQVDPQIASAELFSRQIQLSGQVMDLERIADFVSFQYDDLVEGYEKITLFNSDYGVHLTLQNQSSTEQPWTSCAVTAVGFVRNNVLLGKGVSMGMSVEEVCHAQTGLYGQPTKMSGTVWMGFDYAQTQAFYSDPGSGDRVTLTIAPSGNYITGILYELALYE